MGIENPLHLLFLAVVALVVLGPKRLPELARALGKGVREFREAISIEGARAEPPQSVAAAPAPVAAPPAPVAAAPAAPAPVAVAPPAGPPAASPPPAATTPPPPVPPAADG